MAQNIINKEPLNTKENTDKKLINTLDVPDTLQTTAEEIQASTKSNATNKVSSIDPLSINDVPLESVTDSSTSSVRKYIPLIYVSLAIILFFSIFSTAFALVNSNSSKIIFGVSVNGINLSGLTTEQATQKLSDEFSKKLDSPLTLTYGEYTSEFVPAQDIKASYNIAAAVENAYSIGRSGNLIQNNYEILVSLLASKQIHTNLQYNTEQLNTYIDTISVELPGLVQHPSYYIENQNLIIVSGTSGIVLLQDQAKNLILSNIENFSSSSINLPTQHVEPNPIDIEQIHEEIYSEPENAYIIQEPFELSVGSSGVDFALTIEEAQNLLTEEKTEYRIPLKLTEPEIGVEDLGDAVFVDNLGTFSSTYKESNVNRSTNVKLATNKINNVILLPGEEFSYNKVVGERTYANGFREASVYTSSGVVNGLGGGICQVSSTLYNAVLRANLEIVERKNHRYAVSYVPLGTDATVAYGSIDFRFKNNRTYPIKVVASSINGLCTVSIMGIKEETEYEVSITTNRLQTIPYQTQYIEDSSMMVGTEKQTQYGDNGYKYETYKTLKLDGNVISSEKISTDSYTPLTRVVRIGTKQPEIVTPPTTDVTVDSNSNSSNEILGNSTSNNASVEIP